MITIHLELFAAAKDLAGFRQQILQLDQGATAGHVLDWLESHYPAFRDWRPVIRLAVNQTYVQMSHPLQNGDVVAVIPPVSGG